jgi:choline dehydrogenase
MDTEIITDFLVIGMGAGGALVLRMLSDAKFDVLGLEAGRNYDSDPLIYDSTNAPILERDYSWKFLYQNHTTPNPKVNGMTMNYTTGRLLGGGTSINGEQYVRSPKSYWDEWAAISGSQWSGDSIYDAYQDLEDFVGVPGEYNPSNHGVDGRMKIRQAPVEATSMAIKFATALSAATSEPIISDYNEGDVGVFTRWSLFQNRDGTRASSSTNFLQPILDRVLTRTTVTKVLFDRCKRVIGAEAIHNGRCITIKVRKRGYHLLRCILEPTPRAIGYRRCKSP